MNPITLGAASTWHWRGRYSAGSKSQMTRRSKAYTLSLEPQTSIQEPKILDRRFQIPNSKPRIHPPSLVPSLICPPPYTRDYEPFSD